MSPGSRFKEKLSQGVHLFSLANASLWMLRNQEGETDCLNPRTMEV